jgi:copper chaperone NosL
MTAVDKTHASEYVTNKGKAYVFDAIECMVNKINEEGNEDDLAYVLVANYSNPGELIDAKTSSFLISQEIKSPMGAFLSAFKTFDEAKAKQSTHGGNIYSWEELKEKFLRK